MESVSAVVVPVLLIAVFAVLLIGVFAMMKGGEFNRKYGNKLMRWRVGLQALVVLFLVAALFAGAGGD